MSANTIALGTILIADDNQSAREVLEMMLRSHGYRVFAVSDGQQALQLLQQEAIDLALIDVVMPDQTGFAVCRAAKDRPETRLTPIVLITGLGRVEDRIQGIEAGADDFLIKPVRKEELLARVKSLVRIKRFTDELGSAETVVFTLTASIEAKDPYGRTLRPAVSVLCGAGRAAGIAAGGSHRLASRRRGSRHRQGRGARACTAKARAAGRARAQTHGDAYGDWRAHLRTLEIVRAGSADHPLAS